MTVRRYVVAAGIVGEPPLYRWIVKTQHAAREMIAEAFKFRADEEVSLYLNSYVRLDLARYGVDYAMLGEVKPAPGSPDYNRWKREDEEMRDENSN